MIKQQEIPSPVITPETQSRISECKERGCWESLWNVKKRNPDTDSVSLCYSFEVILKTYRWLNSTSIYLMPSSNHKAWKGALKTVLKKIWEFPNINPGQKDRRCAFWPTNWLSRLFFLSFDFLSCLKWKEWPKLGFPNISASLGQKWREVKSLSRVRPFATPWTV